MEPSGLRAIALVFLSCFVRAALGGGGGGDGCCATPSGRGRLLLGFKEARGNASFQCAPSGPCIPCFYSEKNDEKYRCSETGYRIPLKCVEIQGVPKEETMDQIQSRPSSIKSNDTTTPKDGEQSYITFRSCVPADGEEKLSFLEFEVIMVCMLLVCLPLLYLRRKQTGIMPGAVRIPTNSPRF